MADPSKFRSDVSGVIFANLSIALVSSLAVLIVPKVIGAQAFSYWQLFVFYGSYALMAQLGVGAGANLRYGGMERATIVRKQLGLQAAAVLVFTLTIACFLLLLAPLLTDSPERRWVLALVAIFLMSVNVRHFILMQVQAVADFRTFTRVTVADRLLFLIFMITLLAFRVTDFRLFAAAEIVAKVATLGLLLVLARELLPLSRSFRLAASELLKNVAAGIKLTMASTSNLLIIGVARFLIDRVFGIVVFGSISLVLNLASLFMIFINAVGLVLFPALRRTAPHRYAGLYKTARLPLSLPPLIILVLIWPITEALRAWLPEYVVGIQFVPILLPIIAFESRMGLLILPFMKALRKENLLLKVNLGAVALAVVLSTVFTLVIEDLTAAVSVILLVLGVRAVVAEVALMKLLHVKTPLWYWPEIGVIASVVVLHWFLAGPLATALTAMLVGVCLLLVRKPLIGYMQEIRRMLRRT